MMISTKYKSSMLIRGCGSNAAGEAELLIIILEQGSKRHIEYVSKSNQFNVGNESLPGFDSLNGILVYVDSFKL